MSKEKEEHEPVFGIIYGVPKSGKSVSLLKAFVDGLFVAPPGALMCSEFLGFKPNVRDVVPGIGVERIIKLIDRESKNYPAIIIDDFTLIADAELLTIRAKVPGFAAFDVFNKRIYQLRDVARNSKCHIFLVMHEQAPREVKKDNHTRWIPGAPLIAGWQLPEKLPAMADFVARMRYDDDVVSAWPYVYNTEPDANYITGSRLPMIPEVFPPNIREVMLASGYDLPRPAELKWLDKVADEVCKELVKAPQLTGSSVKDVLSKMLPALAKKHADKDTRHLRWAISDGVDRATLRFHEKNLLDNFVQSF